VPQAAELRTLVSGIKACKMRIGRIAAEGKIMEEQAVLRLESHLRTLRVFETEYLCQLQEWDQVLQAIGVTKSYLHPRVVLTA
jgi:hypothetical protein